MELQQMRSILKDPDNDTKKVFMNEWVVNAWDSMWGKGWLYTTQIQHNYFHKRIYNNPIVVWATSCTLPNRYFVVGTNLFWNVKDWSWLHCQEYLERLHNCGGYLLFACQPLTNNITSSCPSPFLASHQESASSDSICRYLCHEMSKHDMKLPNQRTNNHSQFSKIILLVHIPTFLYPDP